MQSAVDEEVCVKALVPKLLQHADAYMLQAQQSATASLEATAEAAKRVRTINEDWRLGNCAWLYFPPSVIRSM
jgi:hypothetical protein